MTTALQEIAQKAENDTHDVDENCGEATKELYRRDESTGDEETSVHEHHRVPTPTTKIPSKIPAKSPKGAETPKKRSNSGIPLRLKSGASGASKSSSKAGTYRHQSSISPSMNRNTLEMQFLNNKKRLVQMHTDLMDKQRPLMDMHKSLLRTKKQLEELGKKVVLEDLKVVSLQTEDATSSPAAGESATSETALNLKASIETAVAACVKVCRKCISKRDHVMKLLESATKGSIDTPQLEAELEELQEDKADVEQLMDKAVKENEKKIEELLTTWQKSYRTTRLNEEMTVKLGHLEETTKQQQRTIADAEESIHSTTRRFEDQKNKYEKALAEQQELYKKLEEEFKKEKKLSNENVMKCRNMRSKMGELETKAREAEEKSMDAANRHKTLQDQIKKKEIQWIKEKEELKKSEELLQQKFIEKQTQFDTRLKDAEKYKLEYEKKQETVCRSLETQMGLKEQECLLMEREKNLLNLKTKVLEDQIEDMKRQIGTKDREIEELSSKGDAANVHDYKLTNHWAEVMEYKHKVAEVQNILQQQTEQISKMQGSLKAHAKLATALKMEKDNAIAYSNKLREILQEAREEIDYKNKTIYKIHEKLVLKEKACDRMKTELKSYDAETESWSRGKCQICLGSMATEKQRGSASCIDSEVGKFSSNLPQLLSESLMGMSAKRVDNLRARLDNLKRLKLPSKTVAMPPKHSWSHHSCSAGTNLHRQIELRGKLYQILQNHADQSCEDFINLLKLTFSGVTKGTELNPSNSGDDDVRDQIPPKAPFDEFNDVRFSQNLIRDLFERFTKPTTVYDDLAV